MLDVLTNYLADSGFGHLHWSNLVMIGVGLLFIYLAIKKGFEPLLLVPIGFGMLIGNIPYNASKLPLSVYDGPVAQSDLHYYEIEIDEIHLADHPSKPITLRQYREGVAFGQGSDWPGYDAKRRAAIRKEYAKDLRDQGVAYDEALKRAAEKIGPDYEIRWTDQALSDLAAHSRLITLSKAEPIHSEARAQELFRQGRAAMVNEHSVLSSRRDVTDEPAIVDYGQGRQLFVRESREDDRYPELWSARKQDPFRASVFWYLFAGVGLAGFYPPLIFLGIGALTDFGPMLANPKTLLLGAAAQFGIFGALFGALMLGFTPQEAASIGIIGGADGPTAIFTAAQLAPDLLGAVALAAYSYMAMVPIIQPPIIKLLTSKQERLIRMQQKKEVSRTLRIVFPLAGFLLTAMIAPGGLPLLGMLFFGNLLRESLVTERLAKTSQTAFIDIITILLGVTVGAKTSAPNFLTMQTIFIFLLGIIAFGVATATGVLFGKLMNKMSKEPINPMIGAAGVSAVPMAARVVHKMGTDEDPQNFLLMHAMGPNVAGVIGSAVAAGVLLSYMIS